MLTAEPAWHHDPPDRGPAQSIKRAAGLGSAVYGVLSARPWPARTGRTLSIGVLVEEHALKVCPRYEESLEGEIANLPMYSKVYRTHLRTYLEALLRNVDELARAEQSPPGMEHKTALP